MMVELTTPLTEEEIQCLYVGDQVLISGFIFCGRDTVLPQICELIRLGKINEMNIDLQGKVIFHTAVSPAGVGPTSSNKFEIEESIPLLSQAGVKMHLGKGSISLETIEILNKYNAVYAIIPPVTALLGNNTISQKVVAFPELGIEAFYELEIKDYPAIIAAAHGESIY